LGLDSAGLFFMNLGLRAGLREPPVEDEEEQEAQGTLREICRLA